MDGGGTIPQGRLEGLNLREGLTAWTMLHDDGTEMTAEEAQTQHAPPVEAELQDALRLTRRLHPEDNNTGGFYVALLRHRPEATPEGVARTLVPKRPGLTSYLRDLPGLPSRRSCCGPSRVRATGHQTCSERCLGVVAWKAPRGVADEHAGAVVGAGNTRRQRRFPGRSFHPLKAIHVGLPTLLKTAACGGFDRRVLPSSNATAFQREWTLICR